ncbi:MAG: TetR family transcriptional regulator [Bacillota bacterium]
MRDRLLKAAAQVVVRDGVQSLTLEAVAREAGVSKGGLLYHFHSKSDLISAVVEQLGSWCDASQTQAMASDPHRCGAFARAYLTARVHEPESQRKLNQAAFLAGVGTDLHYLDPFRKRATAWQAQLEADGIDPVSTTIARLAMDGLCLCALFGLPVPEGELRRNVIERLLAMTSAQQD